MVQDISRYKLSFLGTGHMATSMIYALLTKGGLNPSQIIATHYNQEVIEQIKNKLPSISVSTSNIEATKAGDIIFLCVRPQQIKSLAAEISSHCTSDKIIVSIAAGIKVDSLRKLFPNVHKIFHFHPSSLIFQLTKEYCVSFLTIDPHLQDESQLLINIFSSVSEVLTVEESEINKFIVMVGCVPGYVALFWKYLFEVAESLGIDREKAFELEKKAMLGVQHSIIECALSPEDIMNQIATSGGVTMAGIRALENENLKLILEGAVNASFSRLKELSEDEL